MLWISPWTPAQQFYVIPICLGFPEEKARNSCFTTKMVPFLHLKILFARKKLEKNDSKLECETLIFHGLKTSLHVVSHESSELMF